MTTGDSMTGIFSRTAAICAGATTLLLFSVFATSADARIPATVVIPSGVSAVGVIATGGLGGYTSGASGGSGCLILYPTSVNPGDTMAAELGQNGGAGGANTGAGGIGWSDGGNGGTAASGINGAGGGGSTGVFLGRTLIAVAAGGGGAAGTTSVGGTGCILDSQQGASGSPDNPGGNGGTEAAAGLGGNYQGASGGSAGSAGTSSVDIPPSTGGSGGSNTVSGDGGGGGGAGLNGGGGGASGDTATPLEAGSGGGGSSYVAAVGPGLASPLFSPNQNSFSSGIALAVWPELTTTSIPAGSVGNSYSATIDATEYVIDLTTGLPPVYAPGASTLHAINSLRSAPSGSLALPLWSVTPSLPAGLTLDPATGAISGTPTAAAHGTYVFSVSERLRPDQLKIDEASISLTLDIAGGPGPVVPASAVLAATGFSAGGPAGLTAILFASGLLVLAIERYRSRRTVS